MRLDGIPTLDLWDLIVLVLGNTIKTDDRTGQPVVNCDKDHGPNKRSQGLINILNDIDCVPSNVQLSHEEALLYVFEDIEAVIKMIVQGRSRTMRHVSRTHRVALDWLFDRINLNSKIQIKYIDTKNQLADILTKGNFTRDEWNHLLCLFNISHFSSTVCSEAKAKRLQQDSGEERVTAKSRPMMGLIARVSVERIILDVRKPGEEKLWKSKSLECELLRERGPNGATRYGQRPKKPRLTIIMNNLLKALSQHATQSGMITKPGLLKSGKLILRCTSDRGNPLTQHDGTALSIVNEVILRDRTGQPVVIPQRGATPQQFIIGNDETELEIVSGIQIILKQGE